MARRFFVEGIAIPSVLLLLFSISCSQPSQAQHKIAHLSLISDPAVLDPRQARDLNCMNLIHMLFEGLTRASKTGETELAIAESVEIDEAGVRYVFHLRESFWSNGDPLTASDFVFSWKTILDPRFATDIAYQLYPIKNAKDAKLGKIALEAVGLQALDEQTLIVELEQPVPYFFELLSMPAFYPVPSNVALKNPQWHSSVQTFVSNGPFTLQTWKHNDQLRLLKNRHYWEMGTVQLSEVKIYIASPETALQMFEEGKLDWVGSPLSTIPTDAIDSLKKTGRLETSPFLGTAFYRINTSPHIGEKQNPLADPRVRRALASAIERNAIVDQILQGGQIAAQSLVPPEMGLQTKMHLPDRKERLVEHLNGPITVSYSNSERNASVAQAVQRQWESAFGIQVLLEAVEPKAFFQRISNKDYQIAAGSWIVDYKDSTSFLEVFKFKEGSTNNTGWEDLDYIDLLNRSTVCKIGKERNDLLCEAEAILMDQMPIIPIFHCALNYAKRKEFKEVVLSSMGQIDLRWAYFEEVR